MYFRFWGYSSRLVILMLYPDTIADVPATRQETGTSSCPRYSALPNRSWHEAGSVNVWLKIPPHLVFFSSVHPKSITSCIIIERCYCPLMIKSFRCKETQKIFGRKFAKKLPTEIQETARMKLVILDAATSLNDLRVPPGNRLEELKDDRKGQHSIRINSQWRICFEWKNGNIFNVEIVDYH